ncbi:MAG: hypothetical protein WA347_06875 [Rhabdochlamydiaceae bacterium]|jgi:uncharacterized membrane protein
MKKITMMMFTSLALAGGIAANAEEAQTESTPAQKAGAVIAGASQAATKLSVEEQAFVAKLSDQNRKAFSDKLSADQRKSVIIAVKNGASADEAVQQMIAAKELNSAAVANSEETK